MQLRLSEEKELKQDSHPVGSSGGPAEELRKSPKGSALDAGVAEAPSDTATAPGGEIGDAGKADQPESSKAPEPKPSLRPSVAPADGGLSGGEPQT